MAAAPDERALLIVGGGRMREALLAGLLAADELAVAEVSSSRRDELAAAHPGVTVAPAPIPTAGAVLAVKPADVADAAVAVVDARAERLVSVAAGVTTQAIERAMGGRLRVVRAMPNTPALVGAVAAAICAGSAGEATTSRSGAARRERSRQERRGQRESSAAQALLHHGLRASPGLRTQAAAPDDEHPRAEAGPVLALA